MKRDVQATGCNDVIYVKIIVFYVRQTTTYTHNTRTKNNSRDSHTFYKHFNPVTLAINYRPVVCLCVFGAPVSKTSRSISSLTALK